MKIRRKYWMIILGLVMIAGFVYSFQDKRKGVDGVELWVGDATIEVEIADTNVARVQGLSGREFLDENRGVLFIFPDSRRQSFWMKEMKFDLDMIFINEGRVIEVYEQVPAPIEGQEDGREIKVVTKGEADMVLEVNSGWVRENGIKVGDKVELNR